MQDFRLINSKDFVVSEGLVLVKPIELEMETTTSSGLIVLNEKTMTRRPSIGKVISSSEKFKGKYVAWEMQSGLDLMFNDGKFLMLKEVSIIGTVAETDILDKITAIMAE